MDLRTPLVTQDNLHPNFRVLIKPGFFDEVWDTPHKLADGLVDRDGKFVSEFQTTPNSSFGELYLHAVLRELVFVADDSFNRPDFVLQYAMGTPDVADACATTFLERLVSIQRTMHRGPHDFAFRHGGVQVR